MVEALVSATGLSANAVRMAESEVANSPRPALPYVTIKFMVLAQRFGDDVTEQVGAAGDGTMVTNTGGPRGIVVSFNAYGSSHEQAADLVARWQASLDTEAIRSMLGAAGVAIWRIGDALDLSTLLDSGFEGRSHIDVSFGVASNIESVSSFIESVDVSSNVT